MTRDSRPRLRPARVPVRWSLLALATLASSASLFAVADNAAASRPFSYTVMHRSTDPRQLRHWLLIKTVTGPDKPRRVTARSGGISAPAKELATARGRWIVSRRTPNGGKLIHALRAELRHSNHVALRAVGHYKCSATFRVRFRITGYNDRAASHFEDATGCV
jgi:hypothetical protein